MDIAIINKTEEIEQDNPNLINLSSAYTKVDDIPFVFFTSSPFYSSKGQKSKNAK